eukprot:PITA_24001
MTFSFEDWFDGIDEALKEVKAAIFRILQDPLDLTQPEWDTQLSHALECYNVTAEEEDDDPQNINIPETEDHREVEPKFVNIGDYCDNATVDKVIELLHEYHDLFPTKFTDLKGIIGDLGVLNIMLNPDMKPVKQRHYRLNPKYKEKVHLELDKMLIEGIIEPVEESNWVSPMVVQEKKQKDEIRICMDLRKLNDAYVHGPFSTPFTDEVLDNVGG